MNSQELPLHPSVEAYEKLAEDMVAAIGSGDSGAIEGLREYYNIGRELTVEELRINTTRRLRRLGLLAAEEPLDSLALADARDLVADSHGFESWATLCNYIQEINQPGSSIREFETAVDAVVNGNVVSLEGLLGEEPDLVHARSSREHGATLLHYVSANGVEDYRQKPCASSVEVARLLLAGGAEVDADLAYGVSGALGARYPGRIGSTTLGLVATSIHPAHAGVQIDLMKLLIEFGASVDGSPGGWNPLTAALHNGRPEAARFLAERGARLDLEGAAGVGRLDLVQGFFEGDGSLKSPATKSQMESGLMWACEYGHTGVAELLLDRGVDVGTKVHGMTGLHWSMVGGHIDTIRLLLQRNAPLEVENDYGGTALGCLIWAVRNSDPIYRWPEPDTDWAAIVQLLIDAGATVYENDSDFPTGNQEVDELLRRHGMKP